MLYENDIFIKIFSKPNKCLQTDHRPTELHYFSTDLRIILEMKHKLDDVDEENKKKKFDNFSEEPRPGPSSSGTTNPFQVSRHLPPNLNFSDSDSDEDDYDRESLLKNIDLDLKRIISR